MTKLTICMYGAASDRIDSISYDHMEILGDTLEKIAAEKAGIIKNGIPVVAVDEENGAFPVIERTAKEKNTRIRLIFLSIAVIIR